MAIEINDLILPDIPTDILDQYQYAIIVECTFALASPTPVYMALVSSAPFAYVLKGAVKEDTAVIATSGSGKNATCQNGDVKWSSWGNETTSDKLMIDTPKVTTGSNPSSMTVYTSLIWANHDIYEVTYYNTITNNYTTGMIHLRNSNDPLPEQVSVPSEGVASAANYIRKIVGNITNRFDIGDIVNAFTMLNGSSHCKIAGFTETTDNPGIYHTCLLNQHIFDDVDEINKFMYTICKYDNTIYFCLSYYFNGYIVGGDVELALRGTPTNDTSVGNPPFGIMQIFPNKTATGISSKFEDSSMTDKYRTHIFTTNTGETHTLSILATMELPDNDPYINANYVVGEVVDGELKKYVNIQTNRMSALMAEGQIPFPSEFETPYYPIPIPKNTNTLEVGCTGLQGRPMFFNLVDEVYTLANDAGWQTVDYFSYQFEPNTYGYFVINFRKEDDSNFTSSYDTSQVMMALSNKTTTETTE